MVDNNTKVERYISYFKERVSRLKAYVLDEQDAFFKKNILVSTIDTLSRVTANPGAGNRESFTAIVRDFSEWEDHDRVSATHVGYLLGKLDPVKYQQANEFVQPILEKNSDGTLVRLDRDPKISDFNGVWPVPNDARVLGRLSLESCLHLNLLYAYRNSLVHELREPGQGMEFSNDNSSPYYHGMSSFEGLSDIETKSLELVYPLDFYFSITEKILNNVEVYLKTNNIDPYGAYDFGSSWLGELNA